MKDCYIPKSSITELHQLKIKIKLASTVNLLTVFLALGKSQTPNHS